MDYELVFFMCKLEHVLHESHEAMGSLMFLEFSLVESVMGLCFRFT